MAAFAVNAVATLALGIPAGRLTDLWPRRRTMRLGWTLEGAGALALAWAPPGVGAMVVAGALVGAGLAFGFTAYQSYVADVVREHRLARAYGAVSAAAMLASAGGPVLGGVLLLDAGPGPFGVASVAVLVAVSAFAGALVTFVLQSFRTLASALGRPPRLGLQLLAWETFRPPSAEELLPRQRRRQVLAYATAWALLGLGYGMTAPWMGPYVMERFGVSSAAWGVLLGWGTVAGALGVLAATRVPLRRVGALPLASALNVAVAGALVVFALADAAQLAAVAFVARMLFGNVTAPLLNAGLLSEAAEAKGRSLGLMSVAWNLAWAGGTVVGSLGLESLGAWNFVVGAFFLAVGPFVGWAINRGGAGPARAARAQAVPEG